VNIGGSHRCDDSAIIGEGGMQISRMDVTVLSGNLTRCLYQSHPFLIQIDLSQ
jgi:hypothetical protein